MKYHIALYLGLAGCLMARGQLPGFPLHANGLLYSDTLMGQLRHLADSMIARPRPAGRAGDYYSIKQTTGRLVRVDTGNVNGAFDDLRKGISYTAFVGKYSQADTNNRILVILNEAPGYQVAGTAAYYKVLPEGEDYSASRIILVTDEDYRPLTGVEHSYYPEKVGINGNCVYYLSSEQHTLRKKNSQDAYTFAFFLDGVPKASRLPESAMELIRWRDKVVDTAIDVYYKDAPWVSIDFRDLEFGPAQKAFDAYVERKGDSMAALYRPTHPYQDPRNARMEDFELKRRYIDSLQTDPVFKQLLAAAVAEVEAKNYYPFIYLERYMDAYSPKAALEIRRHWKHATMDNFDQLTPRLYAMHIAYLAAELGNWPVFLRAQLALAIDPSGHYPDLTGSMRRNNYLRELEALNIDVDEILLGNELSSPWPDQRFDRARLLGRALALEGGDRRRLEGTVLKLITDAGLDDYHRLAMHYLFLNYESFLPEDGRRSKALERLKKADDTLPGYLSATVKVREKAVYGHADLPSW